MSLLGLAKRFLKEFHWDREWLAYKFGRSLGRLRARWLFGNMHAESLCVKGKVVLHVEGTLRLGKRITFLEGMIPTVIRVAKGATLCIGDDCAFNYGVSFDVRSSLHIGNRCMFGSSISMCDFTGEQLKPTTLGDDVWVAHGASWEPGIHIGDGAVLAAGSFVAKDVPPGHLALGCPARTMDLKLTQNMP
ncbi:MAG: acyltransferase [Proteobacteria bacterium]|nr:acyltransferase [Cystobacterineae bacterium]MCL2259587.1 acyltransferase [Cystobacterineae bacterium]MCL2314342.1 acyltransferase [Pseudomonadota bacterium]